MINVKLTENMILTAGILQFQKNQKGFQSQYMG